MRKSTTLSWIEQAEAARVLSAAAFEDAAEPSSRKAAGNALTEWCGRVCSRLTPAQSFGWPAVQLQPVPVRGSRSRPASDDQNFGCYW
jgi:hypothetical protein